jgi:hypothetical protein
VLVRDRAEPIGAANVDVAAEILMVLLQALSLTLNSTEDAQ